MTLRRAAYQALIDAEVAHMARLGPTALRWFVMRAIDASDPGDRVLAAADAAADELILRGLCRVVVGAP